MIFLQQIKEQFENAQISSNQINPLRIQLRSFITSELKPYYSTMFMQKFKKIKFFKPYAIDNPYSVPKSEKEDYFNRGVEKMCNLIDEIISNIDEYKKPSPQLISGDVVFGDKAGRDINKAGADIVFGNKTNVDENLNKLKNELNRNVENSDLKNELIEIVDQINSNRNNKEKSKELVNKLWDRGSQFMTIIGPFAPYLFGLLQ
ncbi:hypothetical protein NE452_16420 [Paeniclostridium sordellii]|uniref:hypothetical protein n=1 Tax=Paraclostridium sordellii TaxID=1505 RepID=UPI00210C184E|nr:hypothetical protein [Paeniclostridium sordellii]MCQ4699112.1 hypothetical protein [Paeniclostridium sordellii]